MPETEPTIPAAAKPKRKRRWLRVLIVLLIGIPVLLVATVYIIGQTGAIKSFVEPMLAKQFGVQVEAGSIKLAPDGTIVIRDAVFESGDIRGEAARLVEIDRAVINVDWGGALRGRGIQVSSIEIDRPTIRVSQDAQSGRVNLAELEYNSGGGGGATPRIELRNGILEIGEHEDGTYRKLKVLSLRGRIDETDANGVSKFALVALPTEAGMGSPDASIEGGLINLTGEMGPDGVKGRLDGLRLQDWPSNFVPTRSRGMYERLALSGELAPTMLNIDSNGEVEVILMLDGVAMNLPFDDSGSMTGSGDLLRMRRTRGTVVFGTRGLTADLRGLIDELEYTVELNYRGLDAQSAFDVVLTTDFRLDDRFRPAKFLPENVLEKLDRFSNPVADVHARVLVERAEGASIRVSGEASISNGSATYKKFRYPFHQLEGEVAFDPDRLIIKRITGVGPSGATLEADGLFSPLGEDSVVTINLRVGDLPMDEHLMGALDADQRELAQSLFSEQDYQQLLDEQLLLDQRDREDLAERRREIWDRLDGWDPDRDGNQAARDALAAQLGVIDRMLSSPEFSFGGKANAEVVLRRHPERPADNRWTTDVQIVLPTAGLVPGHFPLPIVAHDVELQISDERVELAGGTYSGIGGGSAEVSAVIDRTKPDAKPVVSITASEIPIDDRLVAAIPGYHAQQSGDPDAISLRRILDRMRLGGSVECRATIGPRSDNRLGFDVEATITKGYARPIYQGLRTPDDPLAVTPGSNPLALDDLYGTVYVTEELIIVDLSSMLSSPELPIAPTPVSVLTQLTLPDKRRGVGGERRSIGLLPTEYGPPVPGAEIFASARVDGLDFAMPLQHAVAVVSPRIARELIAYRDAYNPDGVLAIDATLEGFVGGASESSFTLDRIESLAFTYDETRYRLGASWGRATLDLSSGLSLRFDDFRVPIETQGRSSGVISIDGPLPLTRPGQLIEIEDPETLSLSYERGTLDSPIAKLAIDRFGSEATQDWLTRNQLWASFDLDITLTPVAGLYRIPEEASSIGLLPVSVHGSLEPASLSLTMNDREAVFESVTGRVLFEGYEGRFADIRAEGPESSIGVTGTWTLLPGQGLDMDLIASASGSLLEGPTRAILPPAVGRVIDSLQMQAEGGVSIDALHITTTALGTDRSVYDIRGEALISQGSAVIGLPISELSGTLGFAVRGQQDTLGYELRLEASKLRAGLMRVHDASVQIIGDADSPGIVLIPEIIAGMHGGRIAGSAQIRPNRLNEPQYWMELHASGIRAAPVFDDLLLPPGGLEGPPRPGRESVLSAWSQAEDLSRGSMLADLTMTGPIGVPERRVGRGSVEIKGGSVLALPGLINLIEASNLSLPTGATIDLAQARFYVDGPNLAFEQLSASSRRVEILGYGTVNWENRGVDLRFRSRAINPIPIVSSLFETLRDELITTRVTGTIDKLEYSVSQFSGTRQLVNALLGNPLSEQEQRIRLVEQQVQGDRIRVRRSTSDEVHRPSNEPPDDRDWSQSAIVPGREDR